MLKKGKKELFAGDSSDSDADFNINKDYASNYEKWRQKEELQKLKDKYGSDISSSSESEDEIPLVDKDFLKTLSLLKSKDPQIYDESVHFFKTPAQGSKKIKDKKPKKVYLKDQQREFILEKNGRFSDDENEQQGGTPFNHNEKELQEIKNSFKTLQDSDSETENMLEVRQKTSHNMTDEEDGCVLWLKGEKCKPSDQENNKELQRLYEHWNDPNLDPGEKFLKDYLLNKKFAETADAIPFYDDVTNDVGTLSEDETALEKQEIFEHKYNFRFEEPDEEFIKSYPRTTGDSLRQKDNRRKQKREDYVERKRQEKEEKREEIKRLKSLMRKEIEDKLCKLKETAGDENLAFDTSNIEDDFDPAEHDRKMQEMFNDEFYNVQEANKPEFPSDEELDHEDWDTWNSDSQALGHNEPHCEDPDFIMDADYDPKAEFQKQMLDSSKNKKNRKKSKLAAAISKEKPVFNPSERTFEEYFDHYYKLDCEDFIGDLPVRYKYRKVLPNDFGLSIEEILKAKDKELNRWCSIKKTSQYLAPDEETRDLHTFKKRSQDEHSKRKILLSLFEDTSKQETPDIELSVNVSKKRKRKAQSEGANRSTDETNSESKNEDPVTDTSMKVNDPVEEPNLSQSSPVKNTDAEKKRKKKRKKGKTVDIISSPNNTSESTVQKRKKKHHHVGKKRTEPVDSRLQMSDTRLKAYGLNPKKFKRQIIFGKKKTEI